MRSLLIVVMGLITLGAGVAQAIPGPDADPPTYFEIIVDEGQGAPEPRDMYSRTTFFTADGWDFGDRRGYRCAWVEFFQAGNELFEVHYQEVADYPFPIQIDDRFGGEGPDDEAIPLCGLGLEPAEGGELFHDGSDHFPHGTALTFFKEGVQIATIDYHDEECAKGYWTPGDEPGEAWLWWDEDGPQSDGHHDLDCGGGPGEPIAVVRAWTRHMAAGVDVCTEDSLDGDQCLGGPSPLPIEEHASTVTLMLRGDIRAFGSVKVPDGTVECTEDRVVLIQRRVAGDWTRVGKDRTSADGGYALHLGPRDGRYRSRVLKATLGNGDVCKAATSQKRVYVGG